MPRKPAFPKFCVRSSDGIAYVKVGGRKHYLGKHDSEKAQRRYSAICSRITAGVKDVSLAVQFDDDGEIKSLVADYLDHAKEYYGEAEYTCMAQALSPLITLFGDLPPDQFGPRDLVAVRNHFATSRVRSSANHNLSRVKRFWRWCCERELCDPALYHRLTSVRGLRAGEMGCRESEPVLPVGMKEIRAILPYVSPTIGTMLQVQYLAGMRPQDVCQLRRVDIDRSGAVWLYAPAQHKNTWRGLSLLKAIPPRAQPLLAPYLERDGYCFRPLDSWLWWHGNRTDKPANVNRKFSDYYDANSYRNAVAHGFNKHDKQRPENTPAIERWTPNQLRHGILSEVSYAIGGRAAKEWAGHKNETTTLRYTSADYDRKALELAAIANQMEAIWAKSE